MTFKHVSAERFQTPLHSNDIKMVCDTNKQVQT